MSIAETEIPTSRSQRGQDSVGLLYGFFGSNFGDLAVTQGALKLIGSLRPGPAITVVAQPLTSATKTGWHRTSGEFPGVKLSIWDQSMAMLRSGEAPSLSLVDDMVGSPAIRKAVLDSVGRHRHYYYGGGEHLFSYGRASDEWNLIGRILPMLCAAQEGIVSTCLPSTFGPFESEISTELFRRFSASVDTMLSRDARSETLASSLTGRGTPAALDPAFFLEPVGKTRSPAPRSMRVGLVMRVEKAGLRIGAQQSKEQLLKVRSADGQTTASRFFHAFATSLLKRRHEVRILVQCDADREHAHILHARLASEWPAESVQLVEPATLASYLRAISFCDAVATTRFHSAIFALISGSAPFGLFFAEHGPKMPGLFEMLGIAGHCDDIRSVSPQSFAEKLSATMRQENQLGRRLRQEVAEWRGRTISLLT